MRNLIFCMAGALIMQSCEDFKKAVEDAVYPKVKGSFKVTSGTKELVGDKEFDMSVKEGKIILDKEGEGEKKFSLKNFQAAGMSEMSWDIQATFTKIESVPAYKIEFKGIEPKKILKLSELSGGLEITYTAGEKIDMGLSVDKIILKSPLVEVNKIVMVEPIINKIPHEGKKYAGIAYISSSANITLKLAVNVKTLYKKDISDTEIYLAIEDPAVNQEIRNIVAGGGNKEATLKRVLAKFKEKLKNGIPAEDLTKKIILVAEKE